MHGVALFGLVWIVMGVADAWICTALNIPAWLSCFFHGGALSIYALENWVLLDDLNKTREAFDKNQAILHQLQSEYLGLMEEVSMIRKRSFRDSSSTKGWTKAWSSSNKINL